MDKIVEELRDAYDKVAYKSDAYRNAHPYRLAVEAALRGIPAPLVENSRILEIGCASGGNIIPMAEQLPGSQFLGIDLSSRQIGVGSSAIHELGLSNIELRCLDLMQFPANAGHFDYIIAHGVYSWVPKPVQLKMLEICRDHLSPLGMAYISYNTYPGWRQIEIGRRAMLYSARHATTSGERVTRGRQILQFITENAQDTKLYREILSSMQKEVSAESDDQLLHDIMETINEPKHFFNFIEELKASELAYVATVYTGPDCWFTIPPSLRQKISEMSADPLEREQFLDFVINRRFRSSVLCHAKAADEFPPPATGRLHNLYVAANLTEVPIGKNAEGREGFEFATGSSKVHVSELQALTLLRRLREEWPVALSVPDLKKAVASRLPSTPDSENAIVGLENLIEIYHRLALIELWPRSTNSIAFSLGHYPRATRYARWQANRDMTITSLRHVPVNLDPAFRQLFNLLDGNRDRNMLTQELVRLKDSGTGGWPFENPSHLERMIESALKLMASSSLLVNDRTIDDRERRTTD